MEIVTNIYGNDFGQILACSSDEFPTLVLPSSLSYFYSLGYLFISIVCISLLALFIWTASINGLRVITWFAAPMVGLFPLFILPFIDRFLFQAKEDVLGQGTVSAGPLLGHFFTASIFSLAVFRTVEMALDTIPPGATMSLTEFINYINSSIDPVYTDPVKDKKSVPVQPSGGALMNALIRVPCRLVSLSAMLTLHAAHSGQPFNALFQHTIAKVATTSAAAATTAIETAAQTFALRCMNNIFESITIWLFLALTLDVGSVLLLLQGRTPIVGFRNPVFASTSPADFWGKRWNLQINANLKRTVYIPLVRSGCHKFIASVITFVASGLFHEYQFYVGLPGYKLGGVAPFFLANAFLVVASYAVPKSVVDVIPNWVKVSVNLMVLSPFGHWFSGIWHQTGFWQAIYTIAPILQCKKYNTG